MKILVYETPSHSLSHDDNGVLRLAHIGDAKGSREVELTGRDASVVLGSFHALERNERRGGPWGTLGTMQAVFDSIAQELLSREQHHAT